MKALIFDFETTGLTFHPNAKPSLQPRAIEFAGVLVDAAGTELETLTFVCNPEQQISPEITKITGLINEDLAAAEPFDFYLEGVREIMRQADLLVAHNLPFDHAILQYELERLGALREWPWPRLNLCTAQLYEPTWGRRPRLIELYEDVCDEEYAQTHRALDDVRALARIVKERNLIELITSTPRPYGIYFPTGFRPD